MREGGDEGDDGPNSATEVPQIAEIQGTDTPPLFIFLPEEKKEKRERKGFHHVRDAETYIRGEGRCDKELDDPLFWSILKVFLDP